MLTSIIINIIIIIIKATCVRTWLGHQDMILDFDISTYVVLCCVLSPLFVWGVSLKN